VRGAVECHSIDSKHVLSESATQFTLCRVMRVAKPTPAPCCPLVGFPNNTIERSGIDVVLAARKLKARGHTGETCRRIAQILKISSSSHHAIDAPRLRAADTICEPGTQNVCKAQLSLNTPLPFSTIWHCVIVVIETPAASGRG
jgi:hypothetical protein